jgi:hypothetical protein
MALCTYHARLPSYDFGQTRVKCNLGQLLVREDVRGLALGEIVQTPQGWIFVGLSSVSKGVIAVLFVVGWASDDRLRGLEDTYLAT